MGANVVECTALEGSKRPGTKPLALYAGLMCAALSVLPWLRTDMFFHHVMIMFFLYASMSQAWNLVGGYAGQVSFGHAVFFGIGAYTSTVLLRDLGLSPWIGMVIGGILGGTIGGLVGYPCFRLRGHYFAIATFALIEITRNLFCVWSYVDGAIGIELPVLEEGLSSMMFYGNKLPYYYISFGLFVVVTLTTAWVERSKIGYYLRAIKNSHEAAASLGVDTAKYKVYAMVLSGFFSAVCGSFYAQYILHIDPPSVFGLGVSVKMVLMSVLGGAGTLLGPIIGAAILVPLSEYSRAWLGGTGQGVDLMIFGLLITVTVLVEPRGVMGLWSSVARRFGSREPAGRVAGA